MNCSKSSIHTVSRLRAKRRQPTPPRARAHGFFLPLALLLTASSACLAPRPADAAEALPGRTAKLDPEKLPQTAVLGLVKRLDVGRVICSISGAGWALVGPSETELTLNANRYSPTWLTLELMPPDGNCDSAEPHKIFFYRQSWRFPTLEAVIHAESQVLEVSGRKLADRQLVVSRDKQILGVRECVGQKTCTLPLGQDHVRAFLDAETQRPKVSLWPAKLPLIAGDTLPCIRSSTGEWSKPWQQPLASLRFEFSRPLVRTSRIEAARERVVLPLSVPRAIAQVSCRDASCSLTRDGIEVFSINNSALSISVRVRLRSNAVRLIDGRPSRSDVYELPVVRCGMRTPNDVALLSGARNHYYYVAVGKDCFEKPGRELAISTQPPANVYIKQEVQGPDDNWRYFQIAINQVPEDVPRLRLTLARRGPERTTIGAASIPVIERYAPVSVRFRVRRLGLVDFIPSNQSAKLSLVFERPELLPLFSVRERSGFYTVEDAGESVAIRAVPGATGSVPLQIAYRPPAIEAFLGRKPALAIVDTEARYRLRELNLPLALTAADKPQDSFLRVTCRDGDELVEVLPGRTTSIPFNDRNSCRIVIDREQIPEWAGKQRLRIRASGVNELVTVARQAGELTIALAGKRKEMFDIITVSIGHEYGGGHYDLAPRQNLGAEVYYRIVVGKRRFRVSASTSLPTGLFRFGDQRGSVPFSAGAMARIEWLYQEGRALPIGWEIGLLGTGLSGDPHFSIVAGFGFSVPVLNPNTSLQTSFNLHAWMEYSPTRDNQWAFLFGPSFGVGKFSADL